MLGFEVELPGEKPATSRVMVLSGHFDLSAHSAVLEQVSYNGHDSCCYCTEKGETVSTSALHENSTVSRLLKVKAAFEYSWSSK